MTAGGRSVIIGNGATPLNILDVWSESSVSVLGSNSIALRLCTSRSAGMTDNSG